MRLAGLAVFGMVVAAPGRGCNGPDEITAHWTFPDGPGTRGVEVVGCLDWDVQIAEPSGCTADLTGGATLSPGFGRCAVRGWRQDGALRVEGPVVRIDRRQALQEIDLGLPEGPIAGMGAQIRAVGGAVRVERVVPGGPADRAGIEPGDRIVEVDGVRTAGMSAPAFVRAATGLPATPVDYRVQRPGGRIDVLRLLRTRIPADWASRDAPLEPATPPGSPWEGFEGW